MDHVQIRYPTNVSDVARVIKDLIIKSMGKEPIRGIFHFSAQERMTKYDICCTLAKLLKLDHDHIKPSTTQVGTTATRPHDAHLTTSALEKAGISVDFVPFEQWWKSYVVQKEQ